MTAIHTENTHRIEDYRRMRDQSRQALRVVTERHIPRMAANEKLLLAQRLLNEVLDDGVSYADFQSAQAVERYTRKARNAMRGLSLS
jgi:hypothetical protein